MHREFVRGTVKEHEARHRRRVLIVTGILTLIATSPVLGHHLSTRLSEAIAGRDHVWVVCLIALHELLAPVHTLFHVLLFVGVVYAIADRTRAWVSHRHALRLLASRRFSCDDPVWKSASLAGVPQAVIVLGDQLPNPAFTTGWFRPKIYVDVRLQSDLTREQLAAVLAHEYAHVRRLDPARLTLLRALGCMLFWLPALRRLAEDVADDAEIAADNFAVRGDPMVLASAILHLAQWPVGVRRTSPATGAFTAGDRSIVGFQRDAMLDRRIHRLLGDDARIVTHVTWPSIVTGVAGLMLAWSSGIAVVHPMTDETGHCAHRHAWAYEHLFCRAGHQNSAVSICPHEHSPMR